MAERFDPLAHKVCLDNPRWIDETAWGGHVPFAMFCISALRPKIMVELGAHRGVSYCAFCQAVDDLGCLTKCFAVDTWEGDEHAGLYKDEVLLKLRAHHDQLYGSFSTLLRTTFDDALVKFEDGTIDLLHIDGFHSYEAVRHDFETWLPKMSVEGIVLLHDIEVREHDFGVWKYWAELKSRYPHFEFYHSHGLGVVATGEIPQGLRFLFAGSSADQELVRQFFSQVGRRIELTVEAQARDEKLKELEAFRNEVMASRPLRIYKKIRDDGLVGYFRSHPRFSKG